MFSRARKDGRLRAADFIPGNSEHMDELKKMGIRLITLKDGRVQLMHSASQVRYLFALFIVT